MEKTILDLVLQILKHFFGDFHRAQSLKLLGTYVHYTLKYTMQHFRVMIFCNYFSAPPENPRSPRKCQRPQFVRGQSEFHQSLAIPARLRCFSVCGQISRRKER